MRDRRSAYKVLVGRPDGKRPLRRPGRRWENNIKIVLYEVKWGKNWIDRAQDRERRQAHVNAVINLRVT
jgi:hypothetical protein